MRKIREEKETKTREGLEGEPCEYKFLDRSIYLGDEKKLICLMIEIFLSNLCAICFDVIG